MDQNISCYGRDKSDVLYLLKYIAAISKTTDVCKQANKSWLSLLSVVNKIQILTINSKFKEYRGMGSISAMAQGSSDRYFQDVEDDLKKLVPEGIEGRVAYKGNLNEVVAQFTGGLRAGMGYCGAKNISTLQKATFIKITNAGMRESHAHDVEITRESPNYSRK